MMYDDKTNSLLALAYGLGRLFAGNISIMVMFETFIVHFALCMSREMLKGSEEE